MPLRILLLYQQRDTRPDPPRRAALVPLSWRFMLLQAWAVLMQPFPCVFQNMKIRGLLTIYLHLYLLY